MTALAGRVAVVTGAGGGIGGAIARHFAEAGALVACLDLTPPEAFAAALPPERCLALACDVSLEADTRRAVDAVLTHWGRIDVLVNGAAPEDPPAGNVIDVEPADWARVFAVHVTGAYLMSRAALPGMVARGSGVIIHIASQLGHVALPGRPAYCAAKGALLQLGRAMALDHAAAGVRVNTLSPSAVETRRMLFSYDTMEQAREAHVPRHPIGRLGQPDEIAQAALFLATDASSFMTGADLLVDGGYTAW